MKGAALPGAGRRPRVHPDGRAARCSYASDCAAGADLHPRRRVPAALPRALRLPGHQPLHDLRRQHLRARLRRRPRGLQWRPRRRVRTEPPVARPLPRLRHRLHNAPAHGVARCADAGCAFTCEPGFGDCDGDAANGCEADLSRPEHCGACGTACSGSSPLCTVTLAGGSSSRVLRRSLPGRDARPLRRLVRQPRQRPGPLRRLRQPLRLGARAGRRPAWRAPVRCAARTPGRRGTATGSPATAARPTCARPPRTAGRAATPAPPRPTPPRPARAGAAPSCAPRASATATATRATAARPTSAPPSPTAAPAATPAPRSAPRDRHLRRRALRVHLRGGLRRLRRRRRQRLRGRSSPRPPAHCGACGARASPPAACRTAPRGAAPSRAATPGFGDCDGVVGNGCETNLGTNTLHCGSCGRAAPSRSAGAARCNAGRCGTRPGCACLDPRRLRRQRRQRLRDRPAHRHGPLRSVRRRVRAAQRGVVVRRGPLRGGALQRRVRRLRRQPRERLRDQPPDVGQVVRPLRRGVQHRQRGARVRSGGVPTHLRRGLRRLRRQPRQRLRDAHRRAAPPTAAAAGGRAPPERHARCARPGAARWGFGAATQARRTAARLRRGRLRGRSGTSVLLCGACRRACALANAAAACAGRELHHRPLQRGLR